MIYVFDTCSFSYLKFYHPNTFPTIWRNLDALVGQGVIISTKEVWNELQNGEPIDYVNQWLDQNKQAVFLIPTIKELKFVSKIFKNPHFYQLIGKKSMLKGTPVADPFVIACAAVRSDGKVVTEERYKPNAARIPNVCKYFNIPYINFQDFMQEQSWQF
jgi:hypothetical protein